MRGVPLPRIPRATPRGRAHLKPQLAYHFAGTELVLAGVDKHSPFIYDNDIFTDTVDIFFDAAMSRLSRGTMKGIIVTNNILEPDVPFQSQMDDARDAVELCRASSMGALSDPVFGARDSLKRPPGGVIEDTTWHASDGSTTIVRAARELGCVERPLVVFVGGQPTTVASALLQDDSIAERIVVCHVDPLGYNGADSWGTYICAKRARYLAWGGKGVWWWSGTLNHQVILDPPILPDSGFDALPDNPVCTHLKTSYRNRWPNNVYHDLGDGAIAIYLWDRSQFPEVKRQVARYEDGCVLGEAEGDEYDVLTVSAMTDENKRSQGRTFFEVMGNPLVYAERQI